MNPRLIIPVVITVAVFTATYLLVRHHSEHVQNLLLGQPDPDQPRSVAGEEDWPEYW